MVIAAEAVEAASRRAMTGGVIVTIGTERTEGQHGNPLAVFSEIFFVITDALFLELTAPP